MDVKAELKNFKAIDLDEIVRGGEAIPDNVRNSVYLYNKAIEDLRTDREDMAIIKLRKAVALNPHFNEALNLLGVCYTYVGEKEKAAEVFNKVIRSEANSVYALGFMQRNKLTDIIPAEEGIAAPAVNLQQQPGEPLKRIRKKKKEKQPKTSRPERPLFDPNRNRRIARNIARFAAGVLTGLLVGAFIYFLLPKPEPVQLPPSEDEINAAVDEAKRIFDQQYAALEGKYEAALREKDEALKEADYYKAAIKLYEVESMLSSKDYEGAADMLMLMKTIEFRDAEKEKIDSLYEKAMPLAAKSAYDRGYREYNSRKYEDALKSFEKVRIYDPNYSNMAATLYYMGRSHQLLKDSRSALAVYQELVDNYPPSWYTRNAQQRINELTRVP